MWTSYSVWCASFEEQNARGKADKMDTGTTTQLERRSSEPPLQETDDVTGGIPEFPNVNTDHVPCEEGRHHADLPAGKPPINLDSEAVVYLNEQQCASIMKALKTQRESSELCDVSLQVRNQQFFAHRCVLAANSAHLQSVLKTMDGEALPYNVVIPSNNVKAFDSLLDYMYTGQLSISVAIAEELMILSEKLGIGDIRHCCNIHLEKHVDISNWLVMLRLGERFNLEDVVNSVEKCVVENFFFLSRGEELLALGKKRLLQFLSKSNPGRDSSLEHDLLSIIYKWVAQHPTKRHADLHDLLSVLDKNELDATKIAQLFQSNPLYLSEAVRPQTQRLIQEVAAMQANKLLQELEQKNQERPKGAEEEGKSEVFPTNKLEEVGVNSDVDWKKVKETKQQSLLELNANNDRDQKSDHSKKPSINDVSEDFKNERPDTQQIKPDSLQNASDSKQNTPDSQENVPDSQENLPDLQDNLPYSQKNMPNSKKSMFAKQQNMLDSEFHALEPIMASGDFPSEELIADENLAESDSSEGYTEPTWKNDYDPERVMSKNTSSQKPGGRRRRKPKHPVKIWKKGVHFNDFDSEELVQPVQRLKRKRGRPKRFSMELIEKTPNRMKIRHIKTKRTRTRRSFAGVVRSREHMGPADHRDHDPQDEAVSAHDSDKAEAEEEGGAENLGDTLDQPWKPERKKRLHKSRYPTGSAHFIGNQYQCSKEGCRYKTAYRNRMQEHAKAHLGVFSKKVICVICNKEFQHSKHLRRHELIHMDLKQVSCELCKYQSTRRDKLKEHIKRMHPERAVEMGLLSLEAMKKILEHKRTPKPRKSRRKRHIVHYNEDGTPKQEWACDKCPRKFSTPSALGHHKKGHGADTPFLCEHCGFSTIHFASINVHKKQHNGKKFQCSHPGCNYSAIRKSRLEDHMNAHQGIKNHICAICGKAFAGKKHMQRHEKIHQDFKAIACGLCEYRTHRRDKLKDHMRKHHPQEGVNLGMFTVADIERDKLSPAKSHKAKGKKAQKETKKTTASVSEQILSTPGLTAASTSSHLIAAGQNLVVASLPLLPQQQGPQLIQQSHLPGTTTINEEMMQYLTSFAAGTSLVAAPDQRTADEAGSAVSSPTLTPQLPVQPTTAEQTSAPSQLPVTHADQNLLLYYHIAPNTEKYP